MNHSTIIFGFCLIFSFANLQAQTTQATTTPATTQPAQKSNDMPKAPYHSIGEYPEVYTAATVMQRVIDGLGYRYHWATKDLTEKDLAYEPGNAGQTAQQTIDHLFGLSRTIVNGVMGKDNVRPYTEVEMTFAETRLATLENFKRASEYLSEHQDLNLVDHDLVYKRGDKRSAFPFFNLINGQVSDAIYHVGQIVSYRRTTGNPIHPKVNVFMGSAPY